VIGVDFNRVRVIDESEGVVWDRSIIFIPDLTCWIVIDGLLATRNRFRTVSSIWWTTDILAQEDGWYETHIAKVMGWQNRRNSILLVGMPPAPGQSGTPAVAPFRRHFQDELALTRTWAGEQLIGRYLNFVSVLWPHLASDMDESRRQAVAVIPSEPYGRGLCVRLTWRDHEYLFGTLNDLSVGAGQEDIRPTYTAERGMARYGPIDSDAAFVAWHRSPDEERAGLINGTCLSYDGRVLFQALPNAMFQEDRTDRPGIPARFRWETE
jgi:hypothetical protein